MKLPRNLSGADLVKGLTKVGYSVTRQKGSHIRMTTNEGGEHHVTVPNHSTVRVGTLAGILDSVAEHLDMDRDQLVEAMFE